MKQYKLIYKVVSGINFNPQKEFDLTSYIPSGWEFQSFSVIDVVRPSSDPKTYLYHLALVCMKDR